LTLCHLLILPRIAIARLGWWGRSADQPQVLPELHEHAAPRFQQNATRGIAQR
jgi:hypothetical protein